MHAGCKLTVPRMLRSLPGIGLLTLLGACGGNSAGETSKIGTSLSTADAVLAVSDASVTTRQKLVNHMQDRYLWYREMPALDISEEKYSDLRTLLEDLKKRPEDRFSVLVSAFSQEQRIDQGITRSYGLRFSLRGNYDPDNTEEIDLRISGVEDFGTVGLAGIQRGDRIIGAEGQSVNELGYDGFRDLFSEPGLGVERTLQVRHPDGREQSYTITRTEHVLNPVRKQTVFTNPDTGRRVGYVLIEEFIQLTIDQLELFRQDYANLGLDDLIVDLRYNGGGLVSASRDLASTIYGQSQSGDVYTELQRNDKHQAENYSFHYRQFNNAFNTLDRVFILTTESTCSASEEVVNGLKPFMDVITIGAVTCGKPYASRSLTIIKDLVNVNVLDSRSVNAVGEGDFFEGLAPTCEAIDDPTLPFNDPRESLVSVALYFAENDQCPATDPVAMRTALALKAAIGAPVDEVQKATGALLP